MAVCTAVCSQEGGILISSYSPFDLQVKMPTDDDIVKTNGLHELFCADVKEQDVRATLKLANGQQLSLRGVELALLERSLVASPPPPQNLHSSIWGHILDQRIVLTRHERRRTAATAVLSDSFDHRDDTTLDLLDDSQRRKRYKPDDSNQAISGTPHHDQEVNSGLLSQRHLQTALAKSRTCVGHSTDASSASIPVADYSDEYCPGEQTGSFAPLVLDSQPVSHDSYYHDHVLHGPREASSPLALPNSSLPSMSSLDGTWNPATNPLRPPSLPRRQCAENHSAMSLLADFLDIRGRRLTEPAHVATNNPEALPLLCSDDSDTFSIPAEIANDNTLIIPESPTPADADHVILATLEFMKNRSILHVLAAPTRRIHVSEREDLGGADLVASCELAIVIFPLAHIPSGCDEFRIRLDLLSWRFMTVLVIFEAYSASGPQSTQHAFTPPVIQALKRLYRNLAVSDVYGRKNVSSTIKFLYANSTEISADAVHVAGEGAIENGWLDDGAWLLDEQEARINFWPSKFD
jgi:hypothetical protein